MIKITDTAAAPIKASLQQADEQDIVLRIAARRMPDGGIDHTMGLDQTKGNDTLLTVNGVDVAISPDSKALLQGLILDYVEFEPGEHRFIFDNPNDATPAPEQS